MRRPGSMADVLQVQVLADRAGWTRQDPPVIHGHSGVEHRFSVVASSADAVSAFDVLEEVGELEVLSAYIRALDTKANVVLVSSGAAVSDEAKSMADSYGVRVVHSSDISDRFDFGDLARGTGGPMAKRHPT